MAYQKQSNRKSNSKAKTHQDVTDNASIITKGFGYVNFLTERQGKKGLFTSCKVRLVTGSKELGTRQYRELDVIVTGKKAEEMLWDYADALADEDTNVYFRLCFSDIEPKLYERDSETVAGINSYLIGIEKMWIDGELEYDRDSETNDSNNGNDEEQQAAKPRKGQNNFRSNDRQSQTGKASSNSRNSTSKGSSRNSDSSRSSGSNRKRNAA